MLMGCGFTHHFESRQCTRASALNYSTHCGQYMRRVAGRASIIVGSKTFTLPEAKQLSIEFMVLF